MADLLSRLQEVLGTGYRVEKELGGGGMSRVFLAEETRLGRRVVVKVLPPEMAAGVSVDRFEREIHLAAKLQHPHIVPLLTAGSSDDLLYYIMPFIEGESLRAKLAREGELPVGEAVRIVRDVVDALAHAHSHHVVHRDIKPDNVLLSGKHALVTDFGVAKAVAESTGKQTITSMGVALGTPLYMAPEQAAASPNIDHRADIYAVGILAYEMLCGRPPFAGPTPQAVLSAHVTQVPEPCTTHRPMVPAGLNEWVMRCLQKHPADRWQRAEEMLAHLEAMLTPTGGVTPTGTQPVPAVDYDALARRAHPIRVAALFGLASAAVLAVVYGFMLLLGLPDWVFPAAVLLLAIGLPIMVLTGHHERQRALARTTGMLVTTPKTGVQRYLTWRKALIGGALAFGALSVVATAYMAMRVLGIGPIGTLVAAGLLEERDLVIVADFENRTGDSTLGPSVTEALRVDLAQSPLLRLADPANIGPVLRRMDRDPGTPIGLALALEIAEREGAKAVVTGEVAPLGRGYVLSARLVSAADAQVLVAVRESADDDAGIIRAVDRLSAKLRERVGESLTTIRAGEPLEQVTTPSRDALRKYSHAVRVYSLEGDFEKAVPLLEEVIALDTAFAMAYRKLGVALRNLNREPARSMQALTKAFEHRDRLTDRERLIAEGSYYWWVRQDRDNGINAYRELLERYPDDYTGLVNLGGIYRDTRAWAQAEEFYVQAMELWPQMVLPYANTIPVQVASGGYDRAEATLRRFEARHPGNPQVWWHRAAMASVRGDYAGAEGQIRQLQESQRASLTWRSFASARLAELALLRGRLAEGRRHLRDRVQAREGRGDPAEYLEAAIDLALLDVRFGDVSVALRQLDAALKRRPLDSILATDRPYRGLAYLAALGGRVDLARRWLAEYRAEVDIDLIPRLGGPPQAAIAGAIALAEGRPQEAVSQFSLAQEEGACPSCGLPDLARAYDAAGQVDSAIATYERYMATPWLYRIAVDGAHLPASYKRLGELYDQQGERERAIDYYNKFVDLWKDADAELQPVVRDVKQRMARLAGER